MMPSSKEQTRRIYTTALVISFLLIVGSIFLHLRQKTHLGRMSFNFDRDRVKPTSGVETVTWMDDYESIYLNETDERFANKDDAGKENDIPEASSFEDEGSTIHSTRSRQFDADDDVNEVIMETSKANNNKGNDDIVDQIIDEINDNMDENLKYEIKSLEQDSSACLRCLCMTINECRPTFCGSGNPCGLYRISKLYWIDGGKPTILGGSTHNDDQDYLTCVNEDSCSATVIQQYYDRYKQDCNKDDTFDCQDQIALHLLGPTGCLTKNLSYIHANRMKNCLIESNLNYFSYSSEEEYGEYIK